MSEKRSVNPRSTLHVQRTQPTDSRAVLDHFAFGRVVSGVSIGGQFADAPGGGVIPTYDPATGEVLAEVQTAGPEDYELAVCTAEDAFARWRRVPAPRRGEIVRLLANAFREHKEPLARLIALENGKILTEGRGEVQEVVDIADFAVGLSRQLSGLTMQSERPGHQMYEQWHPLGAIGIITAFNFPVAVWSWGWAIAAVCGDTIVWKPSTLVPLASIAAQKIINQVTIGTEAEGVFNLVIGLGATTGESMLADRRLPLIQFTGSSEMGIRVAEVVAKRLGRTILELGGNNGVIVLDDANLELALRAVVFGAVGTAGQRCTTTRRLFVQRGIASAFRERLIAAYRSVNVGDPLDERTLMGPLISEAAVEAMLSGIERIQAEGGEILHGGHRLDRPGYFVEPTLVAAHPGMEIVREELFAPVLYVFEVDDLKQAIALHNSVPQGLSSSLFTANLQSAERFLSAWGSDCGIANVNVGTSGAEIGGAFGGEKATGGGRQAGSDAWKGYMRRQTCTINWSGALPLAQGVQFEV